MASDDNMTIHSSMHEDEDEEHPAHNLSRLSICSSKQSMNDFDDAGCTGGGDMMMMYMSGLSIQSSYDEGEADEEFSNGEEDDHKGMHMYGASSDSDKDIGTSFLSLPGTPLQIRGCEDDLSSAHKEYYCSENEAGGGKDAMRRRTKRNSRRRAGRERWLDREWERKQYKAKVMEEESEGSVVMGRQKSLCMDLGEVKACRDLGFELDLPSQVSFSTMDTASSGGNSPIGSWRISSPGDDPKDVKARLKVWAHAVAASASRLVG